MLGLAQGTQYNDGHKPFIALLEEYCHARCGFPGRNWKKVLTRHQSNNYLVPVKLTNHKNAVASEHKLAGYLLSSSHAYGRHKAAFFARFGFSSDAWETLAQALFEHASQNEVIRIEDSPFGKRDIIDGELSAPGRGNPRVRTIWFIETSEDVPYLVTAYPLEKA